MQKGVGPNGPTIKMEGERNIEFRTYNPIVCPNCE